MTIQATELRCDHCGIELGDGVPGLCVPCRAFENGWIEGARYAMEHAKLALGNLNGELEVYIGSKRKKKTVG